MTIRIVLADDHRMFREALQIALQLEHDLQVLGEAGSGAELFARLHTAAPDILVLDIGLPDMNGIEVALRMRKLYPKVKVIALSGYTDRMFVEEMIKAGARAFVAKSAGSDELVFAIRAVMEGKIFLSPEVTAGFVGQMAPPENRDAPPISVLGKREQEVLRLLAKGKSSPEIAAHLGISAATVNVHRRNIKQKLNLHSIAELTRYAIREGLIAVQ